MVSAKELGDMKANKVLTSAIAATFLLTSCWGMPAYCGEGLDQVLGNSPSTQNPGYINAEFYKSYIETPRPTSSTEQEVERINQDRSASSEEDLDERVKPVLKKKTGTATTATETVSSLFTGAETITDSTDYDLPIGSGTDQEYNAQGDLIAEEINGTRHVYSGFDNFGYSTIQSAVTAANAGDIVIIAGGRSYTEEITVKNGVKLYGGYNDTGTRDIVSTASVVTGGFTATGIDTDTEINGFTINGGMDLLSSYYRYVGINISNCDSDLKVLNNTITNMANSRGTGVYADSGSSAIVSNNDICKVYRGIWSAGSSIEIRDNKLHHEYYAYPGGGYGESGIYDEGGSATVANNIIWNYSKFIKLNGSSAHIDSNTLW